MVDASFTVDSREDVLYLAVGLLLTAGVLFVTASTTTFDGRLRYYGRQLASSPTAFVVARAPLLTVNQSTSAPSDTLVMPQQYVEKLNWANQQRLGQFAVADEMLYCFTTEQGNITKLLPIANISTSKQGKIAGECVSRYGQGFDGQIHTQPGFHAKLSKEDKDLESRLRYMCVQFDELVRVKGGELAGINCWKVTGEVSDPRFVPVEVVVQ